MNASEKRLLEEIGAEQRKGYPKTWFLGAASIEKCGKDSYTVRSPHGLNDRSMASGYDCYKVFGLAVRVLIECHIRNQINRNVTWLGKES